MLPSGSGTEWFEAADYDSDAGQSYSSVLESSPSLAAGILEAEAEPQGSRLHLVLLQGLSEVERQEAGSSRQTGAGERSNICLALSYVHSEAGRAAMYAAGSGLVLCVFTEVGTFSTATDLCAAAGGIFFDSKRAEKGMIDCQVVQLCVTELALRSCSAGMGCAARAAAGLPGSAAVPSCAAQCTSSNRTDEFLWSFDALATPRRSLWAAHCGGDCNKL